MAECSDSSVSTIVNIQKQKAAAIVQSDAPEENKTDRASEPMLVADIVHERYPESYVVAERELRGHLGHSLTKNDLVTLIVYLLMLEEGFVPHEPRQHDDHRFNLRRLISYSTQITNFWRHVDRRYHFDFYLPPHTLNKCRITCVPSFDDLIINCSVQGVDNACYAVIVDPGLYIIFAGGNLVGYQNVRNLSNVFKNTISNRAKADVLRANGTASATLQDLPVEVFEYLVKFVDRSLVLKAFQLRTH